MLTLENNMVIDYKPMCAIGFYVICSYLHDSAFFYSNFLKELDPNFVNQKLFKGCRILRIFLYKFSGYCDFFQTQDGSGQFIFIEKTHDSFKIS